jgi:phage host-nuclease inhibitor protein Gam
MLWSQHNREIDNSQSGDTRQAKRMYMVSEMELGAKKMCQEAVKAADDAADELKHWNIEYAEKLKDLEVDIKGLTKHLEYLKYCSRIGLETTEEDDPQVYSEWRDDFIDKKKKLLDE